jgi:hypothetical protein
MRRAPAVLFPLNVVVACCFVATVAGADPIRVTSGFVEAAGPLDQGILTAEGLELSAPAFGIAASFEEDEHGTLQLAKVPTIAPGQLVDLSGVLHVVDPVGARLGPFFGEFLVAAPFDLSFRALQPARVTCGGFFGCTAVAPFRFDADLTINPVTGGVPLTRHLIGNGSAELAGNFVSYTFAPTPEPSTTLLFTAGAVAAAAAGRRKRRGTVRL